MDRLSLWRGLLAPAARGSLIGLAALMSLAATLMHPALAQQPTASDQAVTVVVTSPGGAWDEIVIAYPASVSEKNAYADFAALCNLGNWPYQDPAFRVFSSDQGGEIHQLVGYLPGFIERTSGRLPLDLLAFVLRRFPQLSVTFLVEGPFFYTGPRKSVENAYVVVQPAPMVGADTFNFRVTIKNPNFESPDEVWKTANRESFPKTSGVPSAHGGGQNRARSYIILAVAAAVAGAGAFFCVYLWRRRQAGSSMEKG